MGFLGAILTPLEPYLLWLKLSIVIASLAGSFLAGVRWESSAVNALLLKQERSTREWQESATRNAQAALDAQLTAQAQMDKLRLTLEKKAEQQRAEALRSANEYWNAHPQDNVVVSANVVRLWRAANGDSDTAGTPETAGAAGKVDATAGTCAVASLHANHEQLVHQYQTLSTDMLELQQWARSALELCNKKEPRAK